MYVSNAVCFQLIAYLNNFIQPLMNLEMHLGENK